ncbi:hypothetical protein [Pseudomonas gingeri]|uniref:hypothetical protein n=1 Tax=Pseudomonas gingeri TaxID=117681 RepID=UPI0015A2267C|nr:hypothetical protein [Pseudomonas gingeri]NWA03757.1 hypothetical protein [Pseudomonas gingeri]NWA14616.1 hypothetical protein [Pseudomonas gingeri]NWA58744.1 hypothetical protein [Pseudomonas gingeri]NWA94490.1 hypothetical protein [Pseudomonas gingeri]NWB01146.1 hypothetical protein [Pseudomonas gingeri]
MNPIAQQALASALGKALPVPQPKPRVPQTFAEVLVRLDISEIDTSGPINRVMYLEGRGFALEMIRCAGDTLTESSHIQKLIQALIRAAISRPASYAKGIKDVIELLEARP